MVKMLKAIENLPKQTKAQIDFARVMANNYQGAHRAYNRLKLIAKQEERNGRLDKLIRHGSLEDYKPVSYAKAMENVAKVYNRILETMAKKGIEEPSGHRRNGSWDSVCVHMGSWHVCGTVHCLAGWAQVCCDPNYGNRWKWSEAFQEYVLRQKYRVPPELVGATQTWPLAHLFYCTDLSEKMVLERVEEILRLGGYDIKTLNEESGKYELQEV